MEIRDMMEIEPFNLKHLEEIAEIHFQVLDGWSMKGLIADIANSTTKSYVAVVDGKAVGFCCYLVTDDAELEFLCVNPKYRQQGIATRLLQDTMSTLPGNVRRVVLEVRESNNAAISLYEKLGFEKLGYRRNFYSTPSESALVMELTRYGVKFLD